MNVHFLIDALVRQTTVLIAQLATSGGVRAPLAHVANQVFLDLAQELETQGVSRKVSADMFGIALRSYQRKLRRLHESSTFRGRSLWEAVLSFVPSEQPVLQAEILRRFSADDPVSVRGVLNDLSDSGLVYRTGSGGGVAYRATTAADSSALESSQQQSGRDELIWAIVFREGPLTLSEVARRVSSARVDLSAALASLVASGRLELIEREGADAAYRATHFIIPLGADQGWEAAVFDHFQAVVKTITSKLARAAAGESTTEVGGSTYSLHVWPGHPHEEEVRSSLASFRARFTELRTRVSAFNATQSLPARHQQVTFYAGQCLSEMSGDEDDDETT